MADTVHTSDSLRIRRAGQEDVPMLVTFMARLALHVAGGPSRRLKQTERDRLSRLMLNAVSDKDKLIVVAEDESSNLAGMAYLAIDRSQSIWEQVEHEEFKSGIIDDVWVEPRYRKQGVSNAMIKALVAFAEKQGVAELVLEYAVSNKEADTTWRKLGFKPTGICAAASTSEVKQALSEK